MYTLDVLVCIIAEHFLASLWVPANGIFFMHFPYHQFFNEIDPYQQGFAS